jgi:hypothetical protein
MGNDITRLNTGLRWLAENMDSTCGSQTCAKKRPDLDEHDFTAFVDGVRDGRIAAPKEALEAAIVLLDKGTFVAAGELECEGKHNDPGISRRDLYAAARGTHYQRIYGYELPIGVELTVFRRLAVAGLQREDRVQNIEQNAVRIVARYDRSEWIDRDGKAHSVTRAELTDAVERLRRAHVGMDEARVEGGVVRTIAR